MSRDDAFRTGEIVDGNDPRRKPVTIGPESHHGQRHDHATWHPNHDHLNKNEKGNKLRYEGRSKFDSPQVLDDVVKESNRHPAIVQDHKTHGQVLVTSFSMPYEVGDERRMRSDGGKGHFERTSTATVVTRTDGTLITAHPGLPHASRGTRHEQPKREENSPSNVRMPKSRREKAPSKAQSRPAPSRGSRE